MLNCQPSADTDAQSLSSLASHAPPARSGQKALVIMHDDVDRVQRVWEETGGKDQKSSGYQMLEQHLHPAKVCTTEAAGRRCLASPILSQKEMPDETASSLPCMRRLGAGGGSRVPLT